MLKPLGYGKMPRSPQGNDSCFTLDNNGNYVGQVHKFCTGSCAPKLEPFFCPGGG